MKRTVKTTAQVLTMAVIMAAVEAEEKAGALYMAHLQACKLDRKVALKSVLEVLQGEDESFKASDKGHKLYKLYNRWSSGLTRAETSLKPKAAKGSEKGSEKGGETREDLLALVNGLISKANDNSEFKSILLAGMTKAFYAELLPLCATMQRKNAIA